MSAFKRGLLVSGGGVGALVAVGLFTFFWGFSGGQLETYSVKLKPKAGGVLEVDKSNKCKQGKKHPGCLVFEEDKIGLVRFYLSGSNKHKANKCPPDGDASKVITKIQLTATGEGGDPQAVKGDFTVFPLPPWVENDAFPNVVLGTGIVYQAALADARTQAWLINMNSHDASAGVFSFWYKVTATDCANLANTWVTDPRGDNEGIN
jgi:hypothetical protein